jgi:hypothetical protein
MRVAKKVEYGNIHLLSPQSIKSSHVGPHADRHVIALRHREEEKLWYHLDAKNRSDLLEGYEVG